MRKLKEKWKAYGSGGIWTHASEETGALNQRLRPLGHATCMCCEYEYNYMYVYAVCLDFW